MGISRGFKTPTGFFISNKKTTFPGNSGTTTTVRSTTTLFRDLCVCVCISVVYYRLVIMPEHCAHACQ